MTGSLRNTFAPSVDRQRRKPPSSSSGERDIKARPSPQYEARKAKEADEQVLLSLDLLEEAAAVDPFHRLQRREVGEVVWDTSEQGIAFAFSVQDDEVVYLTYVLSFGR
jgi:hypothetical protein